MLKQKNFLNQQTNQFQQLPCDSPQIKPSSPLQQPEDINLDDEKQIERIGEIRNRRKKLKAKKTNLIKIKPVKNQGQEEENEIEYLPQTDEPQRYEKIEKISQNQREKREEAQRKQQALQSPVLYRISDDQDPEQREQDIPQSSRRPLNQPKKQLAPIYPIEKRSDSDEPESPVKLISKRRKSIPKQQSKGKHTRRFIKMKREIQLIEKKREPTQVYQYDNDDADSSQGQAEEQQQEEEVGEGKSRQYESQDENQDSQYQKQKQPKRQKTTNKKNIPKPQITIFKSNSFYTLINAQIPKGNFVNCIIKRKRTDEYFQKTVTYELFLLQDKKYLMTCTKNRLFKTTSHFEFYRQKPNVLKYHQENLYAYMDSNFTGTEFVLKTIQRNDTNSQRSTAIDKSQLLKMQESTSVISDQLHKGPMFYQQNQSKINNIDPIKTYEEKQVLYLIFKANFFGFAGQRQVKMLKKKNKKLKPSSNFSNLRTAQQNGQLDKYTQICSKKAIQGKNGLQLDFKGIANMQSTKNIILESQGKEALIFGKVKQDIYAVAIGSPLSIVEGLAFGIANLDRKFFVN